VGGPLWLRLTRLIPAYSAEARIWRQAGLLEAGEAEAIALARQVSAHWLLTDDAAARLVGQSLGLEVHGSLGMFLWNAKMRHLTRGQAESALDRLARSSLWVSASVLRAAKAALDEMPNT
jgi:predicted nucleic acid-binding protein